MDEAIHTTTARIWRDAQGILHIESLGVASTADTVRETFAAIGQILGAEKAPFFFDARNWPSGDADSWIEFIKGVTEYCTAGAILIDPANPPALGAFPEALSRLLVPFSVFADQDAATEFLRESEQSRESDPSGGV